jgi:hypothetical protein
VSFNLTLAVAVIAAVYMAVMAVVDVVFDRMDARASRRGA